MSPSHTANLHSRSNASLVPFGLPPGPSVPRRGFESLMCIHTKVAPPMLYGMIHYIMTARISFNLALFPPSAWGLGASFSLFRGTVMM
ncbi:hypothetical protein BU24DRAFT_7834 [Aaosphaeria arxii CBS 175.79]|uniref:Uncharacterized protein n=1 Tax=Aaosphaeria arxii CBS 175.79 TaxID=1450172 RepID=A0A6A5Y857_9PLEO|nr:uncharacterized protein BU24DRAFT_7834 [Aaosphaeria arxii CBS 175.79]KAF2020744.1 hypothetical protein BU24DRAFT_7834 [Aaosphaeria arxii CBS 175.79]